MPNNYIQTLTVDGTTYDLKDNISGYTTNTGTVTSVTISNATDGGLSVSGSPITLNGTITVGHSNVLTSAQTTQAVYPIKIDKNGHISAYGSAVSVPTKTSDLINDSGFITSYTDTKVTQQGFSSPGTNQYPVLCGKNNSGTEITDVAQQDYNNLSFKPSNSTLYATYVNDLMLNYSNGYLSIYNNTSSTGGSMVGIITGGWYTLNEACAKEVDTSISTGSSSTKLPTSAAVASFVEGKGYVTTDENVKITGINSNGFYDLLGYYGDLPNTTSIKSFSSDLRTYRGSDYFTLYVGRKDRPGTIILGTNDDYTGQFKSSIITANRTWTLPDKTGTIALTTDIPSVPTISASATYPSTGEEVGTITINGSTTTFYAPTAGGGGTVESVAVTNATNGGLTISGSPITTSGTITVGHSNVLTSAQTTSAVYPIKIDKNGHISEYGSAVTVPSITLNGNSTALPSFYAPTSAGTDGYYLKSNGSGAPTWSAIQTGGVTDVTLDGTSVVSSGVAVLTSATLSATDDGAGTVTLGITGFATASGVSF